MTRVKEWLEETERLWSKQLLSFKTHVERASRK
jgi:hypothetical protein